MDNDMVKFVHDNIHWVYYTGMFLGLVWGLIKAATVYFKTTKMHKIIELITIVPETIREIKDVQNLLFKELLLQSKIITTILDSLELAQFLCGPDGKCIKVNSKWISMTGLSEHEAHGHNWLLSVHYEDRDRIEHKWNNMITLNLPFEEVFRYEHRLSKTITKVKCSSTDVLDDGGNRIYILGISKTI